MNARTAIILVVGAALLAGCATAPSPWSDSSWLDRQEVSYRPADGGTFCDLIGGIAESAATACASGVPRSVAEQVPSRAEAQGPEWLGPIVATIIAQAYDLPSARHNPAAFGDLHAALCRHFMEAQ